MNKMDENGRRRKAEKAIQGHNKNVKTIGILSAQNPMGKEMSKEYNDKAHAELIEYLKSAHYAYYVTDGHYGAPETSVMVYNIPLDEVIRLGYEYNQESVIFVEIGDDNKVSYQYWEGDDHQSPLKKQIERTEIIDATDDKDFWTKISRKFRFRIPFFESVHLINTYLNEKRRFMDVDRLLGESTDRQFTKPHQYKCRGHVYGSFWGKNNSTNCTLTQHLAEGMARIRNKSIRLLKRGLNEGRGLPKDVTNQIAMEVFGMPFEQFYRQTGFWVGAEDFEKLKLYFERIKQEQEKMGVVESIVRNSINENFGFNDNVDAGSEEEEYDPWLNGDASYMDGEYNIPYGYHVKIDSGLGYVAIDNPGNPAESYFLQGDEADNLIKQISKYWSDNDCEQVDAINTIISDMF